MGFFSNYKDRIKQQQEADKKIKEMIDEISNDFKQRTRQLITQCEREKKYPKHWDKPLMAGEANTWCMYYAWKKLVPNALERVKTLSKKCQSSSNPRKCDNQINFLINSYQRLIRLTKVSPDKLNDYIENESVNIVENYLQEIQDKMEN